MSSSCVTTPVSGVVIPVPPNAPPKAKHFDVWFSSRVKVLKFHLDRKCDGLEKVADEWLGTERVSSLYKLAITSGGRPCRMCALEPTLEGLRAYPAMYRGHPRLVSFASQGNPRETNVYSFKFAEVTESGAARVLRLAKLLGLQTTVTGAGPIAFGVLHQAFATVLARNLRTLTAPLPAVMPTPDEMSVVWTLWTDRPPELNQFEKDLLDVWSIAKAAVS